MKFTLKQARTYAGMTQREIAEKIGIDRCTYRKIEADIGRATVSQIKAISAATGIPMSDIFLLDDSTLVEHT